MIRTILSLLLTPAWIFAAQFALLVGSPNGGDGVVPLRYVKSDLISMKQVLIENCRFSSDKIVTLNGTSPEELSNQLNLIRKRMSPSDQFFFYYTGHADNRSLKLGKRRFDLIQLKQAFDSIPGMLQIVVLDACQSGSFTRLKGGTIDEPLILRNDSGDGRVVLFSSSESEFSQESDYLKHSIFSYYFINGLRGMADGSDDEKVTVDEAYRYAYSQTVAATVNSAGGVQHPGFLFDYHGKGDIVLSDMTSKTAGIVIDKSVAGQVVIIDGSRQIVADFRADGSRNMIVSLNPGKYTVYRNSRGKSGKCALTIGNSRTVVLSNSFVATRSIPVVKKGGEIPTIVSLTGSVGTAIADHSKLERSLNRSSMVPHEIPLTLGIGHSAVSVGAGFELIFPRGVITSYQVSFSRLSGETENSGTIMGPESDRYSSSLVHKDQLTQTGIRLLGGYRFTPFKRQGISVLAGGSLIKSTFNSDMIYKEMMFNQTQSLSFDKLSRSMLVSSGLKWDLMFSPAFSMAIDGIYDKEISSFGSSEINLDPSGLRLGVQFTFHLNGE